MTEIPLSNWEVNMKQKLLKLFKENGDNSLFVELQKEYGGLVVYYAQNILT